MSKILNLPREKNIFNALLNKKLNHKLNSYQQEIEIYNWKPNRFTSKHYTLMKIYKYRSK